MLAVWSHLDGERMAPGVWLVTPGAAAEASATGARSG
jgi:hypothetical protein